MRILIQNLTCKACGHRWVPRQVNVRMCPRCKSRKWDKNGISKTKGS